MTSIKAGIKFRPLLPKDNHKKVLWEISGKEIRSKNGKHNLAFDNVFDGNSSTQSMYETLAKPIVVKALQGYNGTIFAYGQTSSGKTHCMVGDADVPGIIQFAVKDVFEADQKFLIRAGYIEIYNDKIFDLFDGDNSNELRIFESNGSVATNQKQLIVESEDEVLRHFHDGNKCKRMRETKSNERSSRSHTIFQLTIESQSHEGQAKEKAVSNLYLVDLAGSEKPNPDSPSFNEGLHINKSLLALGKIIRGLAKKKPEVTVNFRECKLTRILSPALGGNSLTAVICTVSPVVLDETYHTFCFAQKARKVQTNAEVNTASPLLQVLRTLRLENATLRREVLTLSNSPLALTPEQSQNGKRKMMKRIESDPKRFRAVELTYDGSEANTKKTEIDSLLKRIANLQKEKSKVELRLKEVEKHFQKSTETYDDLVGDLMKQLKDKEDAVKRYADLNQQKDDEISKLKTELDEAKKKHSETDGQLSEAKKSLTSLLDQLAVLKKEMKGKLEEVSAQHGELIVAKHRVVDLHKQLSEAEVASRNNEEENQEKDKEILKLQKELSNEHRRNSDGLYKLENKLKHVVEHLKVKDEHTGDLKRKLSEAEMEIIEATKKHEEVNQLKDDEISNLMAKLLESRKLLSETQDQLSEVQNRLSHFKNKTSDITKQDELESEKKQNEYNQHEEKIILLERQIAELKKNILPAESFSKPKTDRKCDFLDFSFDLMEKEFAEQTNDGKQFDHTSPKEQKRENLESSVLDESIKMEHRTGPEVANYFTKMFPRM